MCLNFDDNPDYDEDTYHEEMRELNEYNASIASKAAKRNAKTIREIENGVEEEECKI